MGSSMGGTICTARVRKGAGFFAGRAEKSFRIIGRILFEPAPACGGMLSIVLYRI